MDMSEMIANGTAMGGESIGEDAGEKIGKTANVDAVIKKIASKEKYLWLTLAILIIPCVFISCFARNVPNLLLSLFAFTLSYTCYFDSESEEMIDE